MDILGKLVGGSIVLIAVYLFVANANDSSRVINSFATGYTGIIKALQGR